MHACSVRVYQALSEPEDEAICQLSVFRADQEGRGNGGREGGYRKGEGRKGLRRMREVRKIGRT